MKTKSKISGHIVRGVVYAVFLAVAFIAASSAFDPPNKWYKSAVATGGNESAAKSPSQPRAFSFAERVVFQRAIEDVYWRHRIWPRTRGENPDRKPSLDAVMTQAQLESKVAGYLHDSLVLEDYWQRPITAEQLQAEMDRMARDTKQPQVLRELFEALGNDPAVIAECLARPILAERLIADLSAQDQTRHVESQHSEALRAMSVPTTLGQVVYTVPNIADADDPQCIDQWAATTTSNAPEARYQHTAVWTGSEMIVWGGLGGSSALNTGGRYRPSTDSWTATSLTNAPGIRTRHTAVWTGSEMIVWGGAGPINLLNTGGRYNPATNSWRATSTTNAPSARISHTAVLAGDAGEMIVWGGAGNGRLFNTGGRYNPSTDSWTATSTTNAPTAREGHTALNLGEVVVWGGYDGTNFLNSGGIYDPSTDSWRATSTTRGHVPTGRTGHTGVESGGGIMVVWGGADAGGPLNTGGIYDLLSDSWGEPPPTTNAPTARSGHTEVWHNRAAKMIVWGGIDAGGLTNTGGRWDQSSMHVWAATSTTNAPTARTGHTAVYDGADEMIVWGGQELVGLTNTGARFCDQYSSPTPPPTPTAPPLTIIQPNGGEVWLMGSMHEIKWEGTNLTQGDRLIIQYSRDGGAGWFRIAQDVPALSLSYSWRVDNYPTTQGRVKILLQGHREITDQSDANFTVQRTPPPPNDAFASAIPLTGANGTVIGTNVNATNQSASGEPAGENSVWYTWTSSSNGTAHFNIGMDWLTIDVYTGSTIGGLTRVATSSGSPSTVTWTAVEGTTYRIRLTKNTRTADFHLLWTF